MAYRLIEEEEETPNILGEAVRPIARTASNLLTRAIGLPGDVLSVANLAAKPITEAITGREGLPYEKTFLGKAFPTTETHRKAIESKTGEFLKPQNKFEKFTDEVIEDTALLFTPGGITKAGGKAVSATKSLFKALGANIAGETVTQMTGSETAGGLAKIGSLYALARLDQKKASEMIKELYNRFENKLSGNPKFNAARLETDLKNLKNKVTAGRPSKNLSPSEKFVMDEIDKIESLIKNGEMSIKQAWAQKRSLNENLAKALYETPDMGSQKGAKKLAGQLNGYLRNFIRSWGQTNKSAYKDFAAAEEASTTIGKSNMISRFVENNLKYSPLTSGLLHLFGGKIGAAAAKSAIPYQAGKLIYRITKSPTLRKHYLKTLRAAANDSKIVFNKELQKLDEKLQEEDSKQVWKEIP